MLVDSDVAIIHRHECVVVAFQRRFSDVQLGPFYSMLFLRRSMPRLPRQLKERLTYNS